MVNRFLKYNYIKSDTEALVILCQNNTRGLLGLTLALQNFNAYISAITLLYIVTSSIVAEPIMNYLLLKHLSRMDTRLIEDSELNETQFGCFKSCLLHLHQFTLSNWLVKNASPRFPGQSNSIN